MAVEQRETVICGITGATADQVLAVIRREGWIAVMPPTLLPDSLTALLPVLTEAALLGRLADTPPTRQQEPGARDAVA